jgi:hypothetical protein
VPTFVPQHASIVTGDQLTIVTLLPHIEHYVAQNALLGNKQTAILTALRSWDAGSG